MRRKCDGDSCEKSSVHLLSFALHLDECAQNHSRQVRKAFRSAIHRYLRGGWCKAQAQCRRTRLCYSTIPLCTFSHVTTDVPPLHLISGPRMKSTINNGDQVIKSTELLSVLATKRPLERFTDGASRSGSQITSHPFPIPWPSSSPQSLSTHPPPPHDPATDSRPCRYPHSTRLAPTLSPYPGHRRPSTRHGYPAHG